VPGDNHIDCVKVGVWEELWPMTVATFEITGNRVKRTRIGEGYNFDI
jgi:hypothetical protein